MQVVLLLVVAGAVAAAAYSPEDRYDDGYTRSEVAPEVSTGVLGSFKNTIKAILRDIRQFFARIIKAVNTAVEKVYDATIGRLFNHKKRSLFNGIGRR